MAVSAEEAAATAVAMAAEEAATTALAVSAEEAAAAVAVAAEEAAARPAAEQDSAATPDTCVAASALPFLAWALALVRSFFLVLSAGFLSLFRLGASLPAPPALSMADHLHGVGMEERHVASVVAHLYDEYEADTSESLRHLDEADILETAHACGLKKVNTCRLLEAWRTAPTVAPVAAPSPTPTPATPRGALAGAPEDTSPTSAALFPGSPGEVFAATGGIPPAPTIEDLSKGHLDFGDEAEDIKDCCRGDGVSSMEASSGKPTTRSIGGCGANFTGQQSFESPSVTSFIVKFSPPGSAVQKRCVPSYPPPPLPGVPPAAVIYPA
jgi:hypothetical protein